jgi:uncharacterized Zn ribbon protein
MADSNEFICNDCGNDWSQDNDEESEDFDDEDDDDETALKMPRQAKNEE